jgi:hypothetical protein
MRTGTFKVGDIVKFKHFAYSNIHGGTVLVEDETVFEGAVFHQFYDYECGQRLHVLMPDKIYQEQFKTKTKENKFFVSEFDVLKCIPA